MVKCADCGLLGVYSAGRETIHEVNELARSNGNIAGSPPLVCAALKYPLQSEFEKARQLNESKQRLTLSQATLDVLNKPRECSAFCEWNVGFTPKEHKEMQMQNQLEAMRSERDRENAVTQARATIQAGVYGIVGVIVGAIVSNGKDICAYIIALFK